ncbi:hypothetical protein R3P38DRAFT_2559304, partial [Favolaschia claudopus]
INLRTHATVHVCGVSSDIDKANSTFDVKAEQYLTATRTPNNIFPIHCVFPATPRWEKYKPIPGKGKSVSVEGFLTGLELNDDRSVKYVIVDVEKVTFLGSASSTTVPKAEESPTKIVTNGTPACLKFTGFLGGQSSRIRRSANYITAPKSRRTKGKGKGKGLPVVVALVVMVVGIWR